MLWIRDVKKAAVSSMGRCTAEMITRRRGHGTRSSSTHINSGEERGRQARYAWRRSELARVGA